MQTIVTCMRCLEINGAPNFLSFALEDITESGVIEIVCNHGHQTAVVLQPTKFEILSEMGVWAIVRGSYRDAVSSFATSLERFHEHYLEIACRKHSISPEAFAATWKPMSNSSERQLGAFLVAFLFDTHHVAAQLPPKHVEFRNAVIHKGIIPTRQEAITFGQAVFDCIVPVLNMLQKAHYQDFVQDLTYRRIQERSKKPRKAGLPTPLCSLATPLSLSISDKPTDLAAIVDEYAKRPDLKTALKEIHALRDDKL